MHNTKLKDGKKKQKSRTFFKTGSDLTTLYLFNSVSIGLKKLAVFLFIKTA